MSDAAFKIYEKTLKEQHSRNEARRIRARVAEARQSISSAGPRWPFELLQNALDFGPRKGRASVSIRLNCDQGVVTFEHDGVPFKPHDLAALLSGGSSKDFESELTTGRFGTGFLVTHVLAERTGLQGLFETPNGYELFDLLLDRGGDEEAILQNMEACTKAIRAATAVSDLDGAMSASFQYYIDHDSPLRLGIESLKSALPYLYATRQILGRVELKYDKEYTEIWRPTNFVIQAFEGGFVEERSLQVRQAGVDASETRVYRFMTSKQAPASALVQVERRAEGWKVVSIKPNVSRVYREYPLSGSGFLPTNFILDGKFAPDEERSRLLMGKQDRVLVEDAFAAAILAVKYAFANKWEDAHLLVQVRKPATTFGSTDSEETEWWHNQLASFVRRVAELPIVECSSGMLPAVSQYGGHADFIIPSLSTDSNESETTVERIWPLSDASERLSPPKRGLATIWTEIAQGWHSLGVQTSRIGVKDLAKRVRGDADTLEKLQINGDAQQWITLFLDITGECWKNRSGIDGSVLHGMLPDQNQRLRSPSELKRDNGVPDLLKTICDDIGLDIRSQLLFGGFQRKAAERDMLHLQYVLDNAITNSLSKEDVVKEAVKSLIDQLPENEHCNGTSINVQRGSVRLLHYLWESSQDQASPVARQIPLITHDNKFARWSPNRMMMAPIVCWHESAQSFARAYPPDRILAEMYGGSSSDDLPNCVTALINWGIAFSDPIIMHSPSELTQRRLAELSSVDTNGVTVPSNSEEFSQIALLQPEVLNRCQVGIDEARALLGLVLCHIAPHDPRWKEERIVKGRRAGKPHEVPVAAALWLADLKIRPWVPVPGEDGKLVPMLSSAKTLDGLLDPTWLEGNNAAIEMLSKWFDFDQLELRLLGIEPNSQKREQLRDGLARLVESGGSDPDLYQSLAEDIEAQRRYRREIDHFRRLGIGVQEAIKSALETYDLNLRLVDRGFDYEVTVPSDNVLSDVSSKFDVGPYLLEVKATTTGQVRLTPMQAETASNKSDRYVLCVVDLRSVQEEQLAAEWSASRVEPLAKIVPNIGTRIAETYSLVRDARTRSIVVRNESALRYEVPSEIWEVGVSIGEWVPSISSGSMNRRATDDGPHRSQSHRSSSVTR